MNRRDDFIPWRSKHRIAACVFSVVLLHCTSIVNAADKALEIMKEVENRALADSQSYEGAIEVIDAKGKVLNKSWHFWREGNRGNSKVLVRFDTPAEVRGVGLLTLNHAGRNAEQWLYTPAIQRDRRIAPQEKSQRFMGTDFTNEDMEERAIENYDYTLIGEEPAAGQACYKIKAVYRNPANTQYSHIHLWVRKDITVITQAELYIGGRLSKMLRWDEWKQVQNIWTAHFIEMRDLSRKSMTRIHSSNVKYNVKFEPEWFTLRNLRRAP